MRRLDELIRDPEARHRLELTEQAISNYYDSVSGDDMHEQEIWWEFALAQLEKGSLLK